jgi:hypothetical protein
MKRRNIFRVYNAGLGLVFVVFLAFGMSSIIVMIRSDGFVSIEEIVSKQQTSTAIFNSPLSSLYKYKITLHKERAAKIVAIGSSRSFQFREKAFSESFTNLGGVIGDIEYSELFIRKLIEAHKPEIIIWAVDYHDFFEARRPGRPWRTEDDHNIFSPLGFTVEGIIDWKTYWKVMFSGKFFEDFPVELRGLSAKVTGDGFGHDGSFYDFGGYYDSLGKGDIVYTNSRESLYQNILDTSSQGDRSNTPQPWALESFKSIVDYAKSEGVIILPVLVPSGPAIMEIMDERPETFRLGLDKLREQLPHYSPYFADFVDPREYGSGECEFIDAYHGGEVTYLRIVLGLFDMPGSPLQPYVRRDLIRRLIKDYENEILITEGRIGSQFKNVRRIKFSPMCEGI